MASNSKDEYLAKPSGACCLEGTIHEGEKRGRFQALHNINTYIAEPSSETSNGNIVIYFPDVWGFFQNGFLLMDAFADAGYLTIGIDYFQDDPVWKHRKDNNDTTTDPGFDFKAWLDKYTVFADENVPAWLSAVKETFGKADTKYACVGYCFGAPYVCNALADDSMTAGAFAHPAFLKDHHFQNLKKPLFLSCSEVDHTFPSESRRKAIDMLQADGKPYQVQLFSGVAHGFALRCDLSKPWERYAKEQSFKGIVAWFDFWLSK